MTGPTFASRGSNDMSFHTDAVDFVNSFVAVATR